MQDVSGNIIYKPMRILHDCGLVQYWDKDNKLLKAMRFKNSSSLLENVGTSRRTDIGKNQWYFCLINIRTSVSHSSLENMEISKEEDNAFIDIEKKIVCRQEELQTNDEIIVSRQTWKENLASIQAYFQI
jgi:hypothetical protein